MKEINRVINHSAKTPIGKPCGESSLSDWFKRGVMRSFRSSKPKFETKSSFGRGGEKINYKTPIFLMQTQ